MRYSIPTFLVLILFGSLLDAYDQASTPGLDPRIAPFVQEFAEDMALHLGPDVQMPPIDGSITNLRENSLIKASIKDAVVIGICKPRFDGLPYSMDIDSLFFERGSYFDKKALVYHELGHCILHKKHNNDTHEDGRYKTLMSELLMDGDTFSAHEEEYIKELFSNVDKLRIGNKFAIFTRPTMIKRSSQERSSFPLDLKDHQRLLPEFLRQPQHPFVERLLHR